MVATMKPWNSNPKYFYLDSGGRRLGSIRFRNGEWSIWKAELGCVCACADYCRMLNAGRRVVPDKEIS